MSKFGPDHYLPARSPYESEPVPPKTYKEMWTGLNSTRRAVPIKRQEILDYHKLSKDEQIPELVISPTPPHPVLRGFPTTNKMYTDTLTAISIPVSHKQIEGVPVKEKARGKSRAPRTPDDPEFKREVQLKWYVYVYGISNRKNKTTRKESNEPDEVKEHEKRSKLRNVDGGKRQVGNGVKKKDSGKGKQTTISQLWKQMSSKDKAPTTTQDVEDDHGHDDDEDESKKKNNSKKDGSERTPERQLDPSVGKHPPSTQKKKMSPTFKKSDETRERTKSPSSPAKSYRENTMTNNTFGSPESKSSTRTSFSSVDSGHNNVPGLTTHERIESFLKPFKHMGSRPLQTNEVTFTAGYPIGSMFNKYNNVCRIKSVCMVSAIERLYLNLYIGQSSRGTYAYNSGPVYRLARNYCMDNANSLTEKEHGYVAINNYRLMYYLLSEFQSTLKKERSAMEKPTTTRIVVVNPNDLLARTVKEFLSKEDITLMNTITMINLIIIFCTWLNVHRKIHWAIPPTVPLFSIHRWIVEQQRRS
jgi:hypothetical protein